MVLVSDVPDLLVKVWTVSLSVVNHLSYSALLGEDAVPGTRHPALVL